MRRGREGSPGSKTQIQARESYWGQGQGTEVTWGCSKMTTEKEGKEGWGEVEGMGNSGHSI